MIYSDLLSQLSAKRSIHDIFPFFLGGGWTRLDWNNPEHPQIPGQRPHCRESYTSGGQNNTFSAFRCQKIDHEGWKKRPPKLLGPKIRNNKGAREPETSDKSQILRDKNNWWKTYRLVKRRGRRWGSCAKSLTPAEPGTRKGEKKGIGVPLEWDWTLEGRAVRSTEWAEEPPNLSCTKVQVSWENLESCKDKEREGTWAGLAADPRKCRDRWILAAETMLKICLRAEKGEWDLPHWAFQALIRTWLSVKTSTQKFEMLSENEGRTFESEGTSFALMSRWRWEEGQ